MRSIAGLARIAIEHNMSAAARVLEVVADRSNAYLISIGTTFPKDKDVVPELEMALATGTTILHCGCELDPRPRNVRTRPFPSTAQ
jgi:hypothetical protein